DEEAVGVAGQAGMLLVESEGRDAAADYLAEAAAAVFDSTFDTRSWALAEQGLRLAAARRDLTWARLAAPDLDRRDACDPDLPGIPLRIPQRHEVSRILLANWPLLLARGALFSIAATVFESREDVLRRGSASPILVAFWAGEYERALEMWDGIAQRYIE